MMANESKKEHIPEDQFLDYRHIDLHFIYSFCWETTKPIRPEVFSYESRSIEGEWRTPLLHDRVIGPLGLDTKESSWFGAYQPSFIVPRRCLERSSHVGEGGPASLIVPTQIGADLPAAHSNVEER